MNMIASVGTPLVPVIVAGAVLLLASVFASKAAGRFGVPALLLFLAVGMLAGSDGPGGVPFDNPALAQALGIVALAFILFGGGLDTTWDEVRPIAAPAVALATLGVLLTAGLTGWFASWLLGLPLLEGLLLGAIVSSTDAAAVFAVLRSRHVRLPPRLKSLLELESGANDPMAVFLTVGVITLILVPGTTAWRLVLTFFQQMTIGVLAGHALGRAGAWVVNRARLEYQGLYPVVTVALVLLTYGMTDAIGGSGFLAVYAAGIVMRRADFIHKRSLIRFHDAMAWLMQIVMFLVLGLQVFPARLGAVALAGGGIALFLMLVARPLSVMPMLALFRMGGREQALAAWVGLRGAAPIILATFPLVAGVPAAGRFFHLVFFIVLISTLVQGTSIPFVAHLLGLARPDTSRTLDPLDLVATGEHDLLDLRVTPSASVVGRRVVEIDLPKESLLVLVEREGHGFVPTGGTVILGGDRIVAVAGRSTDAPLRALFEGAGALRAPES
jgi:potassium/hydrogen antiporter